MLFEDLSREIVGLSMKVQNVYGMGHEERIYQRALEEVLAEKGIQYISQPKLPVTSLITRKRLGWYQPDLLIEEKILVELKSTSYTIRRFEEQIQQYLKNSKYSVGYLINFGIRPLYFKRFIWSKEGGSVRIRP